MKDDSKNYFFRRVVGYFSLLFFPLTAWYGIVSQQVDISSQIVFPVYHWTTLTALKLYQGRDGSQSLRRLQQQQEPAREDHGHDHDHDHVHTGHVHTGERHHMRDGFQGEVEVDGLRNDQVAVMVTSTAKDDGIFIRDRIIPSSRTWFPGFVHVFVVIEDTFEVRFQMRHCEVKDYEHYTAFECLGEATYIMSRKCNNDYYGAAGPCCKVDDLFNYLMVDRASFFEQHIKYILHADDDTYFRPDQVMRWLAAVENSGLSHIPLIGNGGDSNHGCDGVWHVSGCDEICTVGWYQPLMMNRAALLRLRTPSMHYGLQDTCKGFDVTHDIGVGVYAWLIGAYHIRMPRVEGNGGHKGSKILNKDQMVVHYMKHHGDDHCRDGKEWPEEAKYQQNVVIGCGDVGHPGPLHNKEEKWADMYDADAFFKESGSDVTLNKAGENEFEEVEATVIMAPSDMNKDVEVRHVYPHYLFPNKDDRPNPLNREEKVEKLVLPKLKKLAGYETTEHSKKYKISEEWKPFTMQDCKNKGHVGK